MKTTIYVFTATGNSLWAAERLAEKLGGAEVLPIVRFKDDNSVKCDSERVGFVFPLFFLGIPRIVEKFMQKLDTPKAKFKFAVVTRGGEMMAGVAGNLRRAGVKLDRVDYVTMVDNYIPTFYIPPKDEIETADAKAAKRLDSIIPEIAASKKHISRTIVDIIALPIHAAFLGRLAKQQPFFTVGDVCNGCGQCAKVCPVGNIRMDAKRPVYSQNCEMCLACVHVCPTQAIQFENKTAGKGRYVNSTAGWKRLKEFR